ncbi:MAG TPA: hemolysin family protein [Methylomirabilota bacterium]|nr:hemolysin family protein [Methylomirabilota bacterium]
METTPWIELLLIAVAILINGFFAGSEIALVSSRISSLAEMRQKGVRGAATAFRLKESPQAFLATIQIAITLVGALASAVGGAAAIERLTPVLEKAPLPGAPTWAEPVALGIVILAITYLSLVVGELTPKALALRHPERLACAMAPLVAGLTRAFASVVRVLTASTNVVLRLLGQGKAQESPFISEEEVKYLVREGAARGVFEKVEEELVHNVFEFADATVREIMVPRMNILGLEIRTPPDEILKRAAEIGRSRIPVYRESVEHTLGVVTIKDLFRLAAQGKPAVLSEIMHPPVFVPESARISTVLRDFQRHRQYLALVVNEYGGVVGLVTIEDVLEEIVGEIREEGEPTPSYVTRLADGTCVVNATAPVRDVREALGLPIPDSPDYTTIAGFVIHVLQTVPTPGASVSFGGHFLTVVDMDGPRITKVKVQRQSGET